MITIEPCCSKKHTLVLREAVDKDETVLFQGFGDLSLAELIPALMTRYSEAEMTLAAPVLPDAAAVVIKHWMQKQWARADGTGNMYAIAHLTLVSNLSEKKSPLASAWLKENPFGDRLTLRNVQQNDTCILLPDLALYGSMNLTYGGHFSAIATKNARTIQSLREMYEKLSTR